MYLQVKGEKAKKYSKKAIQVWRTVTPSYALSLIYKTPPQEGLDEVLDRIKEKGKLYDYSIEDETDSRYRISFEINALKMSDDELLGDGEDFYALLEIAETIDAFFPEE